MRPRRDILHAARAVEQTELSMQVQMNKFGAFHAAASIDGKPAMTSDEQRAAWHDG
jgi:hypothetical protein